MIFEKIKFLLIGLFVFTIIVTLSVNYSSVDENTIKPKSSSTWYYQNWPYKREIVIYENSGNNLLEYQVLINITYDSNMQEDFDDLRFTWYNSTSNTEIEIPYFIERKNNSKWALIWVKVYFIPANSIARIYMYYGNLTASQGSNISRTFSYSEPRTVGYIVSGRLASDDVQIMSLSEGNTIEANGNSLNLDLQQTGSFSGAILTQGTAIKAKSLFQLDSNLDTTDTLSPISWAGTEFYYYSHRGTNQFAIVSPFGTANVSIYDFGSKVWNGNVDANGIVIDQDITNKNVVRISSDIPILVQHYSSSESYDSLIFYPATSEYLYGIPSNYLQIGSGPNGAQVNWTTSSGEIGGQLLGVNEGYSQGNLGQSGSAPAYRIRGNLPINVNQLADHDGTEGTTFLPYRELGVLFGSGKSIEYIAVAAPEPSTTCTVYDNVSNIVSTQTGGTRTDVNKIGFGTGDDNTFIGGGWRMECDKPVYAYFEEDGKGDETNLWSWKQMRQYQYPEPTYEVNTTYWKFDRKNPSIFFTNPTELNNEYIGKNFTFVNVSVFDAESNVSAFINWNHSLVGYWSFNEGFGTKTEDKSEYGNNGSIKNGVSWIYGRFGEALKFNGVDGYVDVSDNASLDLGDDDFSIELWVKHGEVTDHSGYVVKGGSTRSESVDGEPTYCVRHYQSSPVFFIEDGVNDVSIHASTLTEDNSWHHIVGVREGDYIKIYVDGKLEGQSDASIVGSTDNEYPLVIGRQASNAGQYLNGIIDEVRIWNRALSPEEINASYNAGLHHLYRNFTNLNDGVYEYYAYAIDQGGNINQTEIRTVIVDTMKPTLTFVKPSTDNSTLVGQWLQNNIEVSDKNLYLLNCTIYNSTGIVYWSGEWDITGLETYNLMNLINISNWPLGFYYENCTVKDLVES